MKLITVFVYIAVLGFTAYIGIMLGKPMFMYHALKADVQDMTSMTAFKDSSEFQEEVIKKAEEYGLEIPMRNIRVSGAPGEYKVSIHWTEMVYLFSKKYDFSFEVP